MAVLFPNAVAHVYVLYSVSDGIVKSVLQFQRALRSSVVANIRPSTL